MRMPEEELQQLAAEVDAGLNFTAHSVGPLVTEAQQARREVEALRAMLAEWLILYEAAEGTDEGPEEEALGRLIAAHAARTRMALGE